MPPHVFSIAPGVLRYARFERIAGVLELAEAREHALPPGWFAPGPLGGPARDPESLAEALDGVLAGTGVEEASLVIADRWFRLAFGELTDLPKSREGRAEAFRFKLRQLVPFRVDELRAVGFEIEPLVAQEEPRRVVIGFCAEALVRQLEALFAERGITLGLITSESLALQSMLEPAAGATGLSVLVLAGVDAYTLLVSSAGGPVLFRHKPVDASVDAAVQEAAIVRELRLTRSFLEERLPGREVASAFVAAAEPAGWIAWLRDGLGVAAEPLSSAALDSVTVRLPAGWLWAEGGPLLGVALEEVA
jgi:hypothetical protein